jgi:hypothetical protein
VTTIAELRKFGHRDFVARREFTSFLGESDSYSNLAYRYSVPSASVILGLGSTAIPTETPSVVIPGFKPGDPLSQVADDAAPGGASTKPMRHCSRLQVACVTRADACVRIPWL